MNKDEIKNCLFCKVGDMVYFKDTTLLVISTCNDFVFMRAIYSEEFYIFDENDFMAISGGFSMPVILPNYLLALRFYNERVKCVLGSPVWLGRSHIKMNSSV